MGSPEWVGEKRKVAIDTGKLLSDSHDGSHPYGILMNIKTKKKKAQAPPFFFLLQLAGQLGSLTPSDRTRLRARCERACVCLGVPANGGGGTLKTGLPAARAPKAKLELTCQNSGWLCQTGSHGQKRLWSRCHGAWRCGRSVLAHETRMVLNPKDAAAASTHTLYFFTFTSRGAGGSGGGSQPV